MLSVTIIALTLVLPGAATTAGDAIPFAAALSRADIQQERLDSVLENAVILGNGDINALVYSRGSQVVISLTKNDVWDARLLTENDPPLPSMKQLKELVAAGWPDGGQRDWLLPEGQTFDGNDSYHAYPFPCPLQCAEVLLACGVDNSNEGGESVLWGMIRAQGSLNEFVKDGDSGVMRIEGKAEDSNGFQCDLEPIASATHPKLLVRVKGTRNARFFVDLMDKTNKVCFSSGWQDTPKHSKEFIFDLPKDKTIGAIILYTWTKDGALAANVFEQVVFKGDGGDVAVTLGSPPGVLMPSRLHLEKAFATIEGVADKTHGATVRALAQQNVFLIESKGKARLRTVTPDFLPDANTEKAGTIDCIVQDVPGDLDWPGMQYAVAMAQGDDKTAVSIVTSLESKQPREDAIKLARATLEEATAACVEKHESIWRSFWSASGVAMEDTVLEQNWYRSLYFLRCVTKPGVVSPGLFAGLINATPAWHGDYHLNYNLQQTFWSAYITNHCDLAEPYDRLIRDYLTRGQWLAKQVYDCEGAFYPHVLYAYEPDDPATCNSVNGRQYIHHVWGLTLGVAGFAVQPLWWRYKYAPDPELLRTITYPPLREVARFYASFIQTCEQRDGVVRLGPSVSPEHWGWSEKLERNYDCAFDIALVRYTLEAAIEAATLLDTDAALKEQWHAALELLPAYPTTKGEDAVVVDVADAPPMEYNISVPATPVYPGDVITWWSDEATKELFTRTTDTLKWNGNNATFMLAISRARLSMPNTNDWLREEILARSRPNGTLTLNRLGHHFNSFGHYTEQFGAAQAISELLVQSVGDIVRVLPAWPLGNSVQFHQLRTQGGFLISGGCEDGKIQPIEIQSTVGGTLRILCPWESIDVKQGGEHLRLKPDGQGIVICDTQPGDVILLGPATAK
jgi:hypothetical protein